LLISDVLKGLLDYDCLGHDGSKHHVSFIQGLTLYQLNLILGSLVFSSASNELSIRSTPCSRA